MTKLFLSYARSDDEPFVRRLHADLTAAGFDTWFDKDDLRSRGLTFHQEIKDAIRERDRLIFIGGPKAAASIYVREEWQLAITLDKPVVPILRLGDYTTSVPGSLALLHCDDFRDNAQYAAQLAKLIENLCLPPPPLGKLFGNLPELPTYFQPRSDLLRRVKDALLVDLQKPVVVTGTESRVGVQGMGGIGKSVLAVALARDQEIRRSYPDGVIWVRFGKLAETEKSPRLEQMQRDVVRYLDGNQEFTGHLQGKTVLRDLLLNKAVVFVFDDVWNAAHVADFIELGPRCRALITTRDSGIVDTLHGQLFQLQLFDEAESLQLLAAATKVEPATLPVEAREVARECGFLPLALSLCAGMAAKKNGRWAHVLERLRRADLDQISDRQAIDPAHRSIWQAMHASVEELTAPHKRRFAELSIFGPRGPIPSAAVQTLWSNTGSLDELDADDLLVELCDRALLRLDPPTFELQGPHIMLSDWGVSLHDLLFDYARITAGDPAPLQESIVAAYRVKAPNGWWTGPHDGYFLSHLREHLISAGRGAELAALLQELKWLEAKNGAGLIFDTTDDFRAAIKFVAESDHGRKRLRLLDEALRRDIHFIHVHRADYPQGLFQCMWNHGWWYDCPDATQHYVNKQAPGAKAHVELYRLLERWRHEKALVEPDFTWLRTLRPPPVHLGTALLAILRGHDSWVGFVSFSPDGQRIVSGGNNTVRVWDAESGEALMLLHGQESSILFVSYSPDGRRIMSGSYNKTVRFWDAESGEELWQLCGHEYELGCKCFAYDGRRIVIGSCDETLRVFDAESGEALAQLDGHEGTAIAVRFSTDGRRIVSALGDKTIRLWDAESGKELAQLRGHEGSVYTVGFSPDGRRIVSGSNDTTIRLWDAESGVEIAKLRGHMKTVASVNFSPNGQRIVSGSDDMTIRLWDAESGEALAQLHGHEKDIYFVEFSPDGRRIVSGSRDTTIRLWDAESGEALAQLPGHEEQVFWEFSPDGQRIVSGSNEDKTLRIWDAESGVELAKLCGHEDGVTSVDFSPNGQRIVSGSRDSTVRVWDVESGKELVQFNGHVYSVRFSPDGRWIMCFSKYHHTLQLWDAETGQCREVISTKPTDQCVEEIARRGLLNTVFADDKGQYPFRMISRGLESVVESTSTGQVIARFHESLRINATHLSGRRWAGICGNHLYLLQLEGIPDSAS